jgi:hypothetical protein
MDNYLAAILKTLWLANIRHYRGNNSTIPQIKKQIHIGSSKWHDISNVGGKLAYMNEVFVISAALIGSYAAFMVVLILFGKLFFPFYTKEQLERQNALSKPRPIDARREMSRKVISQLNLQKKITFEANAYSKLVRG